MKKILITVLLALSLSYEVKAQTQTYTVLVNSGTMTNLEVGAFNITSITLSSTNTGAGQFIDSNTNLGTVYTTLAYSNVLSYLTNYIVTYTNYFGVLTTNSGGTQLAGSAFSGTNWTLVDITNSVASATYNLPSVAVATAANVPLVLNPVNITFYRGISFTNTQPVTTGSSMLVTIVGKHL